MRKEGAVVLKSALLKERRNKKDKILNDIAKECWRKFILHTYNFHISSPFSLFSNYFESSK